MIFSLKTTYKAIFTAILVAAALSFVIPAAKAEAYSAPVYYTSYQSGYQNSNDLIAYLNTLIQQLQLLQHQYQLQYGHSYQGQGTYYSYSGDYDIEVDTVSVRNIDDDEATFNGEVDLDGASFVDVWFVYGTDGRLRSETDDLRIDARDDEDFSIDVDNLDEGDKYYFRAVAEDPSGYRVYGDIKSFEADDRGSSSSNDDKPDVETGDVENIDEDSARLNGEVDMNDFDNGRVFFVYGEDERQVEDVEDEDRYSDVDEDGDDLQKYQVYSNLDEYRSFWFSVSGLDDNTDYYYRICVEYEDDDNDDTLECGDVEDFETDDRGSSSSNDDKPDVETGDAENIDEDSARLNGEVDMNDFDNGRVFFVYGEDERQVEDVEDEDRYSDVDEDGDDLQKYQVYSNLDEYRSFWFSVSGLDDNTDYYYRICVEYEDDDNDDTLECGDVEDFETD